jgi:hypothetical protein
MGDSPRLPRVLQRAVALLLLASTVGALLAPLPATAAPGWGGLPPIAGGG